MTLSDLLARLADVTPEGDAWVALCPAHADSSASLRVAYNAAERKALIKCRAGCTFDAITTALGVAPRELFDVDPGDLSDVRTVSADIAGPSTADRAALAAYLDKAAGRDDKEGALFYALDRFGITKERFTELGLGFDSGDVPAGALKLSRAVYHDAPRLVVPFNDFEGRPHYLQARAIDPAFSGKAKWSGPANPEGAAWGKYGFLEGGSGWAEVLITEGPGDGLVTAGLGYDTVLIRGASLGANASLADELAEALRGLRIVVAGDNDSSGQRFTRDIAAALSERGLDVHRLTIPEGVGKDVADWRRHAGAAFSKAFIRAVAEAPRYGADAITAEEIAHTLTRLFSDVFNAKALLGQIEEQGADVRYTPEAGFVVYRPARGVWELDEAEWTRRQAQEVAPRIQRAILRAMAPMDERVAAITDPALRDSVAKLLDAHRKKARSSALVSYVLSTRGIDAMLRELRALEGVAASLEDFDRHPMLLPVRNGVVNLEDGTLEPFSEATKLKLLMRKVDVDFRPDARNPRWEAFLAETFRDHADVAAWIQRLTGYGITGLTSEQCFVVLWGSGANGKSVFTDVLAEVFGGITTTTPFSTFEAKPAGGIPNDLAALKGARLVFAAEGEQGRPMAEATIKTLTGQDLISARFMRKEFFRFRPTFLIMLATNYRPNFKGQDEGLWRRVKLVPFTRYYAPAERDRYLASKLSGQVVPRHAFRADEDYGDGPAGILAWAVEGARRYFAEGLGDPPTVTAATEEYRIKSDKLDGFYGDVIVRDSRGRIAGKEVWELYREWCDEEDLERKERWTRSTFWAALEERGALRTKSGKVVGFSGIRAVRPTEKHDTSDPARPDLPTDTPF